jgi:hypothetical protein
MLANERMIFVHQMLFLSTDGAGDVAVDCWVAEVFLQALLYVSRSQH